MTARTLGDLVGHADVGHFLASVFGRSPSHARGDPARFHDLMSWNVLNDIVAYHRLDWPRFRLADDGSPVAPEQYSERVHRRNGDPYLRIVPERLLALARGGSTIALDNADQLHPPLDELAFNLEKQVDATVFVNLYASWGPQSGFDRHWDDHDVIVLQVDGTKDWKIWSPTRAWPLYRDLEEAPPPEGDPVLELTVEPGDVLHVPRGWWHVARASRRPSLHVTLGFVIPTLADLAQWLTDRLRSEDALRAPLFPRDADRTDADVLRTIEESFVSLAQDKTLVQEFLFHRAAEGRRHPAFSFPHNGVTALPEDATVRLLYPRARIRDDTPDSVALAAGGRLWRFRPEATRCLTRIVAHRSQSMRDILRLPDGLSDGEKREILAVLLDGGVLALVSGNGAQEAPEHEIDDHDGGP